MNRNTNEADKKSVKRVTFSEISYFIISSYTDMSKIFSSVTTQATCKYTSAYLRSY
ncbi:MAG: hypothetical protein ACTTKX_04785 [Treponema sp.]